MSCMFVNGVDVSPTLSMLTARPTPARTPGSDDARGPHGDATNALAGAGLSNVLGSGVAQPVPAVVLRSITFLRE